METEQRRDQNFFDRVNNYIENTESSIVNALSALAPWLAPLAPAYMTFQHASGPYLNFPFWIAFPVAAEVEILGFATVSTFLQLWFYNRRNQAETKKAPIQLVVIAFCFYLALIVVSNVLLDTYPGEKWVVITVRALYTLQTIPAALIVAVRTQHRDLLVQIEQEKTKREKERSGKDTGKVKGKLSGNFPQNIPDDQQINQDSLKDWRRLRPTLSRDQLVYWANLPKDQVEKVAVQKQVDPKTVRNWRASARKELSENNGHEEAVIYEQ